MSDPRDDDLEHRLSPPVEPMNVPEGAYGATRRRARRRKWGQAATTAATVLVVGFGGAAGGWFLTGDGVPDPGPAMPPPAASGPSATSPPSSAPAREPTSATGSPATPEDSPADGASSPTNEAPSTGQPPSSDAPEGSQSEPTGAPAAPGGGHTTTAALERCHTGEVSARIVAGDAAAGNRYATLVFTNESDGACTLDGHPGMRLLDGNHDPLPTDVRRVAPSPREVVLQPGGTASASLHWTVVPSGDQKCQPPAKYTLVTPPDAYDQLTISFHARSCHGTIFATSVVAGDDGAR